MQQPTRRPSIAAQAERGLTLVEMLVAMVILGFMLTLVSQAVQQVSQLVRAAEATTRTITGGWAGAWALQPTLSNLVWPIEQLDDGFKGTASRIDGFTNAPISGTNKGVQAFSLELRRNPTVRGQTEVWASSDSKRLGDSRAQLVASLDGVTEFAFVDQNGSLSPVWPPLTSKATGSDEVALPNAVVLRRVDSGTAVMWFGFEGEKLRPQPPAKPFWE